MDPGRAPHRPAAADAAAAACAQHGRPPPLPLPPNVSIAELPKRLRPTKVFKAGHRLDDWMAAKGITG